MVCIAVYVVTNDSSVSDETGLVTERGCSIGVLMCVLFVNVFTAVEELWEGFETAKGLPWYAFLVALCNFIGEHGRSLYIYKSKMVVCLCVCDNTPLSFSG